MNLTLEAALVGSAGGYLRNAVRIAGTTCLVCTTTVNAGDTYCHACARHRSAGRRQLTADHVAMLTYAIEGTQSHWLMRGYKAASPIGITEHRNVVALLCIISLDLHRNCVERMSGRRVTHWATVPSLPAKAGEHPLHALLAPGMALPDAPLTAATQVTAPRDFRADHFRTGIQLPRGSHVLVIDDTWTSGGHAQSAALTLRRAGATTVSVMALARYFKPGYGSNAAFIKTHLDKDYDPLWCPWTSGICPD
ncbi:hypothetical protein [Amycolatopsis jejuensis]|uniref:hypothetical protein n=1 Tax=Amycolatopsis jejuensis TaxID=330084 RepID=UPI0012E0A597|nr:hypothetical protein [Amycolatopsis jejuensis]